MAKTVVIVGALDTKGREFAFVKEILRRRELETLVVDFGVLGEPAFQPDITSAQVAEAAGSSLERLRLEKNKAEAMKVMTAGLSIVVRRLFERGGLQGIIGMGGTGGTVISTAAMRTLPVGVPKLMLSTIGGGDVSAYVGTRDITMMPSVVDVAGINRISQAIYTNAASAIAGMVEAESVGSETERPLIAASMFGNTTPCVDRVRTALESQGFEVLVFHATGAGGRTMKSLADDGCLAGILDMTPTELADEICGGVFSAGTDRVQLGAAKPLPLVVAPGCVDMCNFFGRATVPSKYENRLLYEWNPNVTLMRTNVEENALIGKLLAATANANIGPAAVILPLRGVSMLDSTGGPFWDPQANLSCFNAIKQDLRENIQLLEVNANINDPEFGDQAVSLFLKLRQKGDSRRLNGSHAQRMP